MGHADNLWALLKPLGPYQDLGLYTGGELKGEGEALDRVRGELELLERETFLDTAEDFGLERLESLLSRRPVTRTPEGRRTALAALLRIGGDSFTLDAINDNLRGCGIDAEVIETGDPGSVEVRFPDVPGVPEGFDGLKEIIEEILPCHLEVLYRFWYAHWALLEERFRTWGRLERKQFTWDQVERQVQTRADWALAERHFKSWSETEKPGTDWDALEWQIRNRKEAGV